VQLETPAEKQITLKLYRTVAFVLFGIGDFVLQFGAVLLGLADHGRGALHFFRLMLLSPLYFVDLRVLGSLPVIPPEGPERGLYTLLGMLLLNTLIWTMFFYFFLAVMCNSKHPNHPPST
jgi:hypothetical protein